MSLPRTKRLDGTEVAFPREVVYERRASASPQRPWLSILIPTLRARRVRRTGLVRGLGRQVRASRGRAELVLLEDAGGLPSGAKRNQLRDAARGDYLAFVDDDDSVADDYVEAIFDRLTDFPDVVTFDLERIADGATEIHRLGLAHADRTPLAPGVLGFRANHLCAWRRDLALVLGFVPWIGYLDDVFWYEPLHASGLARTEAHVDAVLYRYLWDAAATANQREASHALTRRWAAGGVDCYWLDGQIVLAAAGRNHAPSAGCIDATVEDAAGRRRLVPVIDPTGRERFVPGERLTKFHTVQPR